ncbi:MAG: hypothetical protein WED05_03290 [Candidatus Atabeyarchaeum deiterrae]
MANQIALSIRGKEIKYEYKLLDIYVLRYYTRNPRIATIVSEHGGQVTDDIIDQELWQRDATHELYHQIENDGGLINPVLVYDHEVLEGNTRLCCYRHLHKDTGDDKWTLIKSNVIVERLSQEEIYRLLCTEHIAGKAKWDAYDKANLFRKMRVEDKMTLQQIEAVAGDNIASISQKIEAVELMVKNGEMRKDKYSHFEQLVKNAAVQEIRRVADPEIVEKVVELIKDGTIRKAQDVRLIGTVYKYKDARKRVFKGREDIEQVHHEIKAKFPMTDSVFIKGVESLLKRVQTITREERDELKNSKRDLSKVEHLTKELLSLCKEMEIRIHIPRRMETG